MAAATQQGVASVSEFGKLFGPSLVAAVTNPSSLDLIQIVGEGGNVLVNVDKAGAVHKPASAPTATALFASYLTRLSSSASLAQIFADAFSNPSSLDILQVVNAGGNISYWLNSAGVASGS
jgi:hypothetical protein